ncbi:hypothetical protein CFR73_14505 [Novacetimonas maltaceti]|nr:hypothetical protein CFR73_14505 [Novacetimonas maltaceti]
MRQHDFLAMRARDGLGQILGIHDKHIANGLRAARRTCTGPAVEDMTRITASQYFFVALQDCWDLIRC